MPARTTPPAPLAQLGASTNGGTADIRLGIRPGPHTEGGAAARPSAHRLRRAPDALAHQIAERIGAHKFEMWFAQAELAVVDDQVVVTTASAFVARWIESHFLEAVHESARALELLQQTSAADEYGRCRVRVVVASERLRRTGTSGDTGVGHSESTGSLASKSGASSRSRSRGDDRPSGPMGSAASEQHGVRPPTPAARRPRRRTPMHRLGDFVVGDANRLAFEAARRIVEDADHGGVSPLFIHGDCGIGKTHLLQGACRAFSERHGRPELVRYLTGEQFTNEYIAAVRNGSLETFRRQIRRLELLAIDDVQFLSNKVRTQSEFLHTLDAISLAGARVILASDEPPRLVKKFSHALVSRFLSGMVVQIERPDRATRLELVRRMARSRSLPINDAAVEAVASRFVGSVREIQGAVTKLSALRTIEVQTTPIRPDAAPSARDQGEVGLVLVDRLCGEQTWQPPRPIRIGTVVEVVCSTLGVGRGDLMGSSRHRRVVLGRGLVAYLGRDLTTHSFPEIARALGRSYHSTIHTAQQRLARQLEQDEFVDIGDGGPPHALRELVDQLRHAITRAAATAP